MSKPLIAVSGKNGQLGYELEQIAVNYREAFDFIFTGRQVLDLNVPESIPAFFDLHQPQYFINCAAYTAVDKAETEKEMAFQINAASVGVIAEQCKKYGCKLITISTDYVFNGNGTKPYPTDAPCEPVNYYGYSKWIGEKLALEKNEETIIIRTSWVYSVHGNNFVKTMLRLMKDRTELNVVGDQVGSPTYAADLAGAILQMISSIQNGHAHYGIYHYSNTGIISWADFAMAINEMAQFSCQVNPIPATSYPTPAKRPAYSVMDTSDLIKDYGLVLNDWKSSLQVCLQKLK